MILYFNYSNIIVYSEKSLGVFCEIVTIIFIQYHLLNNVEEKHRSCVLIYHNHIQALLNALIKQKLCDGTDIFKALT